MLLFLAKLLDLDKNKSNFLIHLEKKKKSESRQEDKQIFKKQKWLNWLIFFKC